MPEKRTLARARKDKRQGKSASTQAGEFVREEIHHVREGKHGASSPQQAIAIGLSKARKAGVKLPARKGSKTTKASHHKPSAKRSRATSRALKREPHSTASHNVLSMQAHRAAKKHGPKNRHQAALKAAGTRRHERKAA